MKKQIHVDILAVGAHPDDVELGCGGFLVKAKTEGLSTGIIVLTKGDAGRSGNAETRAEEAAKAAKILKVDYFSMLGLPDGRLQSDIKTAELLAVEIAKLRPSIILTHWKDEWHPDHTEAFHLVTKAVFMAQLKEFSPVTPYLAPKQVLCFSLNTKKLINPSLLIDITDVFENKREALACHKSQSAVIDEYTKIATLYGSLCIVKYAESYILDNSIKINNIKALM